MEGFLLSLTVRRLYLELMSLILHLERIPVLLLPLYVIIYMFFFTFEVGIFIYLSKNWSILQVVASMDWPQVTKYKALVSAQPHRQEMIEDLYTTSTDAKKGVVHGGLIR